jgi:hypothetical protein
VQVEWDRFSPLLGLEALLAPAPLGSHGVLLTRLQRASLWVPALPEPLYCVALGNVKAISMVYSPPTPLSQALTRSGCAEASPVWLHASLWEHRVKV